MSNYIYEYLSEAELNEMRSQWRGMISEIKARQPKMVRVRLNKNTIMEIAEGKNVREVLRNFKQGRERFLAAE